MADDPNSRHSGDEGEQNVASATAFLEIYPSTYKIGDKTYN